MPGAAGELSVNSRSMLQIMGAFANHQEVPEAHVRDHSAMPAFESTQSDNRQQGVHIYSSKNKPSNAFAAVLYRDYWY
jgi:hypothetical protein